MNDPLMIYICTSAIICLLWIYYDIFYSKEKEEHQERIDQICWDCNIGRGYVLAITFLAISWLGWILLPIKIFNRIKRSFKGE